MDIYVAFSDSEEKEVIASFSSTQNQYDWPHQGTVVDSDQRWIDYIGKFNVDAIFIHA